MWASWNALLLMAIEWTKQSPNHQLFFLISQQNQHISNGVTCIMLSLYQGIHCFIFQTWIQISLWIQVHYIKWPTCKQMKNVTSFQKSDCQLPFLLHHKQITSLVGSCSRWWQGDYWWYAIWSVKIVCWATLFTIYSWLRYDSGF